MLSRHCRFRLITIILVAFTGLASGLERQRSTQHSIRTLEQAPPRPRRPFSGGKTRLTSTLPTEESFEVVLKTTKPTSTTRILTSVVGLSCLNVVYNTLRPDPDVGLMMRLPRIFWEICIGVIAAVAHHQEGSIFHLFLSMMLCPTGLMDIFFWGPILGATTSFETCTGGFLRGPRVCQYDFGKGMGRLVAMIQSVFGGAFYLLAAALCWSEYWQAQRKREEEARIRAHIVDYSYGH